MDTLTQIQSDYLRRGGEPAEQSGGLHYDSDPPPRTYAHSAGCVMPLFETAARVCCRCAAPATTGRYGRDFALDLCGECAARHDQGVASGE